MKTNPLTKAEKAWLKKLEDVLTNPPSDRIGLYTVGDPFLHAYDRTRDREINAYHDTIAGEFCSAVDGCGASLGEVKSACQIHSTAG